MTKKNTFSALENLKELSIFEHFTGDELKYCGILKDTDFALVKQYIISSGTLTAEEIAKFFG